MRWLAATLDLSYSWMINAVNKMYDAHCLYLFKWLHVYVSVDTNYIWYQCILNEKTDDTDQFFIVKKICLLKLDGKSWHLYMETQNREYITNRKYKNMLGRPSKVGRSAMGNKIMFLWCLTFMQHSTSTQFNINNTSFVEVIFQNCVLN